MAQAPAASGGMLDLRVNFGDTGDAIDMTRIG
jgi:hypothetical protein